MNQGDRVSSFNAKKRGRESHASSLLSMWQVAILLLFSRMQEQESPDVIHCILQGWNTSLAFIYHH